uniref:Translation elongation factor KOW-like domain-containing protein n=1 Tax=Oryza meridionalis TaxID=40149 RepID=A0A0E0F8Y9_9ORYZ
MASLRLRHLSPSGAIAPVHHPIPSSFAQLRRPSSCLAGPRPVRSRLTRVYALSSNDIRVGSNLEVDGAPWKVLEFLHVKPGKGAAFVRTKMRNYITGNTVDKTFRAGSTIPEASISKETKQFTYKDGAQFVFMDLVHVSVFHSNIS